MRIIQPSFEVLTVIDGYEILRRIEKAGRTCYKSEDCITDDSARAFVRKIIASGHESVIEHESISVRIICDRGVSHEIVRHRIGSYSQESTRYCNYSQDRFGGEITVICPRGLDDAQFLMWEDACKAAETHYFAMLRSGCSPQIARSVLPTCLKTEIVVTFNLREWRHFLRLRTSRAAHPQMREIALPLLRHFDFAIPEVFRDLELP